MLCTASTTHMHICWSTRRLRQSSVAASAHNFRSDVHSSQEQDTAKKCTNCQMFGHPQPECSPSWRTAYNLHTPWPTQSTVPRMLQYWLNIFINYPPEETWHGQSFIYIAETHQRSIIHIVETCYWSDLGWLISIQKILEAHGTNL